MVSKVDAVSMDTNAEKNYVCFYRDTTRNPQGQMRFYTLTPQRIARITRLFVSQYAARPCVLTTVGSWMQLMVSPWRKSSEIAVFPVAAKV